MVCDVQARAVKNSAVASQRQATDLAKEGITTSNGDDSQDSEGVGDSPKRGASPSQLHVHQEAAVLGFWFVLACIPYQNVFLL